MDFAVFGLNHRTAPVELREKLALGPDGQQALLREMLRTAASEAAVLSTCNRLELYGVSAASAAEPAFRNVLSRVTGVQDLDPSTFYFLRGKSALAHLVRVAASLDSQIVGETDFTVTNTQLAPANFISAGGEVRLRVRGTRSSNQSFIGRGDFVRFTVESAGSSISQSLRRNDLLFANLFDKADPIRYWFGSRSHLP